MSSIRSGGGRREGAAPPADPRLTQEAELPRAAAEALALSPESQALLARILRQIAVIEARAGADPAEAALRRVINALSGVAPVAMH